MQGSPLGTLLRKQGLVMEDQLRHALAIAQNTRTRLGDVLISEGIIGYPPLYKTLATQYGLPFVDLLKNPPDASLLSIQHVDEYVRLRTLPFARKAGRIQIATAEYSEDAIAFIHKHHGTEVDFFLTSPLDIQRTIQSIFTQTLTHQSTMRLFETSPDASALHRKTWGRIFGLILVLSCIAVALYHHTSHTLLYFFAACQLLYAATMLFKGIIYTAGLKRQHAPMPYTHLKDEDLPVYTVLIPMYKETESMPHLLSAMHRMDYPPAKLDIKLVLEEDDDDTLDAAYALHPRYQFDIIRVPASLPRTKPKACNYALRFARGEFVTVYDADDRPDPKQLKKAVAAFRSLPPEFICLQARLNYYNLHDNLLTRLFSLEYAMLFHVLLHGMARLSMPILLGGTSNHIALARLKELGEWDPFNVTEDADLGTRLAARGYKTAMLDSTTMEEAPNTLPAWFRQRARWIKGYIQTWLVHMRRPISLMRTLKVHGFLGFQFFVALSSFSYLTAPLGWLFTGLWMVDHTHILPPWLYALSIANLGGYIFLHLATSLHLAFLYRTQRNHMLITALLYPFYLILHSFASYLALWQLLTNPYGWNKTSHGKAKTFNDFELTSDAAMG
jgi:glycosyltransferase XagB